MGLVLGTLVIMASRTLAPMKAKPKGSVEFELRLPLLQRALAQKLNVISICAIVAIAGGALTSQRIISPIIGFLALIVMAGLVMKRQTLVLTSQGVLVHNAAFRQWKDFDGVSVRPGKLVLHSPTRLASISLYLPSCRRDEVASIAQRHVRTTALRPPSLRREPTGTPRGARSTKRRSTHTRRRGNHG